MFAARSFNKPQPGAVSADDAYAYRASLIGASHQFDMTDAGLLWRTGRKSGLWRYDEIAAVRLSYRPVSMQARRFRTDLENRSGARITIFSTSWQTASLMAPQAGYRAFVLRLHQRLAQSGSNAALSAGLRTGVYNAAIGAISLVIIAMVALLVRALATGEFAGVVFIVGFIALFGWQIGGFIRRNKPRRYSFDTVPADLLP